MYSWWWLIWPAAENTVSRNDVLSDWVGYSSHWGLNAAHFTDNNSDNSFVRCFSLKARIHCIAASSGQAAEQLPLGCAAPRLTAACALAMPLCRDVFQTSAEPCRQQPPWTPAWSFSCPSQDTQPGLWVTANGREGSKGSRVLLLYCHQELPSPALQATEGKETAQGHSKIRILSWKSPGQLNPKPFASC